MRKRSFSSKSIFFVTQKKPSQIVVKSLFTENIWVLFTSVAHIRKAFVSLGYDYFDEKCGENIQL